LEPIQTITLKRKLIVPSSCGSGAILPLPRDGGAEELHGHPTVGSRSMVWTKDGSRVKNAEEAQMWEI